MPLNITIQILWLVSIWLYVVKANHKSEETSFQNRQITMDCETESCIYESRESVVLVGREE